MKPSITTSCFKDGKWIEVNTSEESDLEGYIALSVSKQCSIDDNFKRALEDGKSEISRAIQNKELFYLTRYTQSMYQEFSIKEFYYSYSIQKVDAILWIRFDRRGNRQCIADNTKVSIYTSL